MSIIIFIVIVQELMETIFHSKRIEISFIVKWYENGINIALYKRSRIDLIDDDFIRLESMVK